MKNILLNLLAFLITTGLTAQDADFKHRSITLGYKGNGITLGNSATTNGIRLNFRDCHLQRVNGVNVTLWKPKDNANKDAIINGLSVGLIQSDAAVLNGVSLGASFNGDRVNGLHIGVLGGGTESSFNGIGIGGLGIGSGGNLNGLIVGGLGAGSGGNINGIVLGGLGAGCGGRITGFVFGGLGAGSGSGIDGIAIGGLGVGSEGDLNGVMIGGLGVGSGESITGLSIGLVGTGSGENLTGIMLGGIGVGCGEDMVGFAFGGFGVGAGNSITGISLSAGRVKAPLHIGIAAASYVNVERFSGLSIALFNRTKELNGVQLGVINYAGNNPKLLRVLPIINMHF